MASSLLVGTHTGAASSQRASMPAMAPQGANDSKWPRSLSCASTRGKYIKAFSLKKFQSRMPFRASSAVCQFDGGSTIKSARRSLQ